MEKEIIIEVDDENENILKLSKEYKFEGEVVSELDFSGLEDLTAQDLVRATNTASNNGGRVIAVPQLDTQLLLLLAVEVTHKPINFFYKLNLKDTASVRAMVMRSFN